MFPGLNPKNMEKMMKQMGIKQEEIDALRVIIEKEDGNIIIENPNVLKINMHGQESFQITGEAHSEDKAEFNKEDIKMIIEKTGADEEDVKESLKRTNDIAETIIELS